LQLRGAGLRSGIAPGLEPQCGPAAAFATLTATAIHCSTYAAGAVEGELAGKVTVGRTTAASLSHESMIPGLTVVILTLNEEWHIRECIESVSAANEILILDSGSSDSTTTIAADLGARVISRPLTDFAEQRNHAETLANSPWILHLDADERVTEDLWREIRTAIASDLADGFLVPCLSVVFGAPLRHGGWYPQYHLRLHRRGSGTWLGSVNEAVTIAGRVKKFREPILHYGHPDVQTFLMKLDRYTTIEAARIRRSVPALSLLAFTTPPVYFVYKYVVQCGFLDGWRGLAVALLLAFYRCVTYLKACLLYTSPSPRDLSTSRMPSSA